jgi:hypothetical protein
MSVSFILWTCSRNARCRTSGGTVWKFGADAVGHQVAKFANALYFDPIAPPLPHPEQRPEHIPPNRITRPEADVVGSRTTRLRRSRPAAFLLRNSAISRMLEASKLPPRATFRYTLRNFLFRPRRLDRVSGFFPGGKATGKVVHLLETPQQGLRAGKGRVGTGLAMTGHDEFLVFADDARQAVP